MKRPYHVIRSIALLVCLSTSVIAQTISWEPANNHLYGMTVKTILVGQDGDLFVGDNRGKMYRSLDDGQSWSQIASPGGGVIFAIVELQSEKLLVCSGSYLYSSINDGETWESLDHNLSPVAIQKFIVHDEDHIFAATEIGVLYSEDEGNSWIKRDEGLTDTTIQALAMKPSGDLFAGTMNGGMFRSSNGGVNWIAINTGLTDTDIGAIVFNQSGTLFIRTQYNEVFASSDNGDHWEKQAQTLSGASPSVFTIDSNDYLYAAMFDGISRSTNNGASWESINNGMTIPFINTIVTAPDYILTGTDGGIFISSDGENWNAANAGLEAVKITALVRNSEETLFAGSTSGVFRSADAGESWEKINTGLTNILIYDLILDDDGELFAATEGDGVWRSMNNGDSWEQAGDELLNYIIKYLAFNREGEILSTSSREIYLSENNGESWEIIAEYGTFANDINAFAVNDSGHIFVGTRDGMFISKNTGESWEQKIEGMSNTEVRSIGFTSNGDVLVGILGDAGYRSTNNGASWESLNDSNIKSLYCFTENDSGHIYAGSNGRGIYRSKDGGITWEDCDQNLPNNFVDAILAHPNGRVFAGTRGSGVYRSIEIPPVGIDQTASSAPSSIALEQNYPNPFNPETEITFRLSGPSEVSLSVFDSRGKLVRRLVTGIRQAGLHRIKWNGRNDSGQHAASGVYICRLETGSQGKTSVVYSKKMLLIR